MRAEWLTADWESIDVDAAVAEYRARGYVKLAGVMNEAGLAALRERADDLMLGRVDNTPFFFQGDAASGRYEDMPLGLGWVGPHLRYRKLEKLERDERFMAWLSNPLFQRIAKLVIPGDVNLYRAILMTKAPEGGTDLPWHQDGGKLWGLSEDATLQMWTALDDAPIEAGAMRMLAGSHTLGLATPLGGAVPPEIVLRDEPRFPIEQVPAKAGDVVVLHTMIWHASGLNRTANTRRAFSACYLPARVTCTRKKKTKRTFTRVW